ncbi:MAG: FAD-binding protein, partial [Clostridia bacterium]
VYVIFDEATRAAGSIATMWLSWPITTEGYVWSKDNQTEIDKGWILKADTIEELAGKMGYAPETITATIDRFNGMVDAGTDADYGREADKMAKIENGPFYAVEITPTLVATTGGAKRDTAGRVLDWDGNAIPNLYEAGELGSYIANLYQNGCFLSEAMLSGRAAAQTVMGGVSEIKEVRAETTGNPWDGAA